MQNEKLILSIADYLDESMSATSAHVLYDLLVSSHLSKEAEAIKVFLAEGEGTTFTVNSKPWIGQLCHVGSRPPSNPQIGELWFDLAELQMMVLIPGPRDRSPDNATWLSISPTTIWQFLVFQRMSRWKTVNPGFLSVDDLFATERFQRAEYLSFLTDVYHTEAVAFACWFGKMLAGQSALLAAKEFLSDELFDSLLPQEMHVWAHPSYACSEFLRMAFSKTTLDIDPDEDYEQLLIDEESKCKVLYKEWFRGNTIGCLTMVPQRIGLLSALPRNCDEFVEIQNAAFRLKG